MPRTIEKHVPQFVPNRAGVLCILAGRFERQYVILRISQYCRNTYWSTVSVRLLGARGDPRK